MSDTIFRAFCPLTCARRLPRLTVRLQVPPQKVAVTEEVLVGHPEELDDFWRAHPEFIWGPLVFAALVRGAQELPPVAARIAAKDMTAYGFFSALHYTVFAIMLSYAFHAFVIMHVSSQGNKLKLQDGKPYNTVPKAMVARSTAAICTSLVYSVFPFAAPSTSWLHFWGAVAALAVFWDAWFYCAHRCECSVDGRALPCPALPFRATSSNHAWCDLTQCGPNSWAHTNKWAYRFFHKTHHLNKHPNCFGAPALPASLAS